MSALTSVTIPMLYFLERNGTPTLMMLILILTKDVAMLSSLCWTQRPKLPFYHSMTSSISQKIWFMTRERIDAMLTIQEMITKEDYKLWMKRPVSLLTVLIVPTQQASVSGTRFLTCAINHQDKNRTSHRVSLRKSAGGSGMGNVKIILVYASPMQMALRAWLAEHLAKHWKMVRWHIFKFKTHQQHTTSRQNPNQIDRSQGTIFASGKLI